MIKNNFLDVTGLYCPLPLLRVKKKIKNLEKGDVLHIKATDPASEDDISYFCRISGHDLLSKHRDGVYFYYIIVKS